MVAKAARMMEEDRGFVWPSEIAFQKEVSNPRGVQKLVNPENFTRPSKFCDHAAHQFLLFTDWKVLACRFNVFSTEHQDPNFGDFDFGYNR